MRVLLVEDDERASDFVVKGLKQAGFSVDHGRDGEEGLHLALTSAYDVGIIDIMLPKKDGLELVEELRRQQKTMPIIILSAKGSVSDRVRGLEAGADDYLPKPFVFTELLARVQALIRRATGSTEPTELTVGDLKVNLMTREVVRDEMKVDLQPKEFALLEYLMRNAGRVVSKTMIMEHVWDYNFDPQTNVVESRICRLRDKIDRQNASKLIQTIRGVGYVLKDN